MLEGRPLNILSSRGEDGPVWHDGSETPIVDASGSLRWCLVKHFAAGGAKLSDHWLITDVSKQVEARNTAWRLRDRWKQNVRERTTQVRESNVEYRRELKRFRATDVAQLESREKYRVLFQNSRTGIAFADDDGGISQINPAMRILLAARNMVEFRKLAMQPICRLATLHDMFSIADLVRRLATEVLGETSSRLFSVQLPSNRTIWLEANSVRMHVKDFGAAVTFTDRTAEVRARESEADQQRHLNRVGRISLAGHMSAALAHELGQPLNASISYAAGIAHHVHTALPDRADIHRAARQLEDQLRQAGDVIKNVRNFVAAHSPGDEMIDLSLLVEATVELLQLPLREADISVDLRASRMDAVVRGSRVELQQVLVNLIFNAIDAMRDAGTKRPAIRIAIAIMPDQRAELSIADNGPGVSREVTDQIFTPYHTTKKDGLGLGLAMSRNIVEAHGGRLWLDEDRTRGARLCFSLPTVVWKAT